MFYYVTQQWHHIIVKLNKEFNLIIIKCLSTVVRLLEVFNNTILLFRSTCVRHWQQDVAYSAFTDKVERNCRFQLLLELLEPLPSATRLSRHKLSSVT
jgi:hypothetical protein